MKEIFDRHSVIMKSAPHRTCVDDGRMQQRPAKVAFPVASSSMEANLIPISIESVQRLVMATVKVPQSRRRTNVAEFRAHFTFNEGYNTFLAFGIRRNLLHDPSHKTRLVASGFPA